MMNKTLKNTTKSISILLITICFWICKITPGQAEAAEWPAEPEINAASAILIEASTGNVIYDKEAKSQRYPASTTKLMTSLLAIENCDLSETVVMSRNAIKSISYDASNVGAMIGEELSMEDCLYAVLLASANEVAYAVAEHVGNGDCDAFIDMMNSRAKELGCVNTHFSNPHGLHEEDHYSCANDLALIMRQCIQYQTFRKISNNKNHTLPVTNKRSEQVIPQTHKILRGRIICEGVFAGKTGFTDQAGSCLVTAAERNGMTLICVVLGEKKDADGYTDTAVLFDYGFQNFEVMEISKKQESKNAFPALFPDDEAFVEKTYANLTIEDTTAVLPAEADFEDITTECRLTQLPELVKGDNVIGEVDFYYGGKEVAKSDIILKSDEDKVIDLAEVYYREYKDTDLFDERTYLIYKGELVVEEPEKPDMRPALIGYGLGTVFCLIILIILVRIYSITKR